MYFLQVRQSLLTEAKSSPNLLSDLAGLEHYIAESYNNRSFIELLQNADDCKSTRFIILRNAGHLFVANNGRIFNQSDLECLCRSASSHKVRGQTIGYRGIGFKSVVGFSKKIHLFSGNLEITFSREKTQEEIPQASRVPLIRIPHAIDEVDKRMISPILIDLFNQGYSTLFVFSELMADEIESEFESFKYSSLLFLNNINETKIFTSKEITAKIQRTIITDSDVKLTVNVNNTSQEWYLSNFASSTYAFSVKNEKIDKLSQSEAVVHSFLPTEEYNGLGVLINGDFSTDPSRRRLIYDSESRTSIKLCAIHFLKLFEKYLRGKDNENVNFINALIPYTEPRLLEFKKASFDKLLVEEIKRERTSLFTDIRLCPSWLNIKDYSSIIAHIDAEPINWRVFEINGFSNLAKYFGAKEDTFDKLKDHVNKVELSILGCVQFTIQVIISIVNQTLVNDNSIRDLKILYCNGARTSLNDLNSSNDKIDPSFITLLIENGITEFEIRQVLKRYLSNNQTETNLRNDSDNKLNIAIQSSIPYKNWFHQHKDPLLRQDSYYSDKSQTDIEDTTKSQNSSVSQGNILSIKRWRSAEEQTLELLKFHGFKLEDVSRAC